MCRKRHRPREASWRFALNSAALSQRTTHASHFKPIKKERKIDERGMELLGSVHPSPLLANFFLILHFFSAFSEVV
jgi:uracil DNA glycosylase